MGNIKHELGRKPSQVILGVFFDRKSQKLQRVSVPTVRWLNLFLLMNINGHIV